MQLNNRTILTTSLACAALIGSLIIGITLGRSPQLLDAYPPDDKQATREAILGKLERSAQQQMQAQRSLFDPFPSTALGSDPFAQMQQRMDQLFGRTGIDSSQFRFGGMGIGMGAGFAPIAPAQIEVEESKDEYRVVISLSKDSAMELTTELGDNTLSISALVHTEVNSFDGGRLISSTSTSAFSRAIPFDSPVDATGMQTENTDSAVVIRIPKLS